MDETTYCSYYGTNQGKLLTKETVGLYMVDQAYKRILDKHEQHLIVMQEKIIKDLKKSFDKQSKDLNKTIDNLYARVVILEKGLKKLTKKEEAKCEA